MSLTVEEMREAARWARSLACALAWAGRQLHRVDEATSGAVTGLADAIRNFDEGQGDPGEARIARLKRFATKRVVGEIRDALSAGRKIDAFEIALDDVLTGALDEAMTPERAVEGYVLGCAIAELHLDGEAGLLRRDAHERLHQEMARIPLESRRMLELHWWDDLPWNEVAKLLGMPERTVEDHWHKLRVHLREVLTSREDTPPPGPKGLVVPLFRPPKNRE